MAAYTWLICGFFGSGKTTFINQVLEQIDTSAGDIAVLLNDFGDVNIDIERIEKPLKYLKEITGGSIFCSCKHGEFMDTLDVLSSKDLNTILIEASGFADPSPMVQDIEIMSRSMEDKIEISGIICIIDATTFLDFQSMYPVINKQIKSANLIIVNKVDLVDDESLAKVENLIKDMRPGVPIGKTVAGKLPWSQVVDLALETEIPAIKSDPTKPDDSFVKLLLQASKEQRFSMDVLLLFLKMDCYNAIRIKGYCFTDHGWVNIDGVPGNLEVTEMDFQKESTNIIIILPQNQDNSESILDSWDKIIKEG
ncbi:MAG: CobW family GTP-binding protein [Promethearchaeota archaeon]